MTVTIPLDYSTVVFQSPSITANVFGADLELIKNCGTVVNYNLTPILATTMVGDKITLTSAFLFALDYIPDGVYNFTLKTYKTIPDTRTDIEQVCLYSGVSTRCKAVELLNTTTDQLIKNKLAIILFALDNINLCDECSCSKMCNLYNELLSILNTTTTTITTNVHTNCGC